jgi:hypothetical protein
VTSKLFNSDKLFLTYFDRWYSQEDKQLKAFKTTRPDMYAHPALVGLKATEASPLCEKALDDVKNMIQRVVKAARSDWPTYLKVKNPINITWIDLFDRHYDANKIQQLLKNSDPSDFGNDLLVTCCEFGAVLGHVLLTALPKAAWLYAWPYWESAIFVPQTGTLIPTFHWAIKKFSSYGVNDGFKNKVSACVQIINNELHKQDNNPERRPQPD